MRIRTLIACSALVAAVAVAPVAGAAAPARCGDKGPAADQVFTGSFDRSLEGAYVMVPFEVPAGTTKVGLRLCHDQPEAPTSSQIKHTLDLGLFDASEDAHGEEEFRGWGGSSRLHAWVSPNEATLGFLPGSIPGGRWAAEIGVAAIATEGDSDGKVAWRLEVYHTNDPADADTPWTPAPYDGSPARSEAGWYAGDVHVHAEHSSPKDASMQEVFDYSFGPRPTGAGLDFITLSDYVTSRHYDEIGRHQARYPGKLIMRSAEVITYRGHINNHGSAIYVDHRTGPVYEWRNDQPVQIRGARPASDVFEAIHDGGGLTQVNHPTTFPSYVPGFGNICRGCSWDYSDEETDWSMVDTFEVATGPQGTASPEGNELGPNPFTPLAIRWWDDLRNQGFPITAVGASDSHHAGKGNGTTQSPIGEATTVVYAKELSERGVADALEKGHAYVKFFSSSGPDLRFEAQSLRNDKPVGRPVMMGDRLNAPAALFEARVLGASPSPAPRTLLVMRNGKVHAAVPVTSNDFTHTFEARAPGIYRLQLQRGSAIEALTNPITLTASNAQRLF